MSLNEYLSKHTEAAPLAAFRILFGIMMLLSIIRFWAHGWIEKLYIEPKFHFSFYGFEFVKPLGPYTYLLFFVCGLSAVFVMIGYRYRLAMISFFLSFTYIELMDKTTYLNHYYFISLLSFLMIFLPASASYSLDAARNPSRGFAKIPQWTVDSIKFLLCIVYFYAGLAKLNSDWLVHAMPLKIWLPSKYDLPIIGNLLQETWAIYAFSWAGALYDLSIPFLLFYKPTRLVAFGLVIVFHTLTRVLFPIGMFPYIMIVSATIFFDPSIHKKILDQLTGKLNLKKWRAALDSRYNLAARRLQIIQGVLIFFFTIQLLMPFRHLAYPGELFWTEEGFRFSWRVMLIEKAGYASFRVKNTKSQEGFLVDNTDFLTSFQEKQMATQPDFILEYAHYLANHFEQQHHAPFEVYVESYVALNGRRSEAYIDPSVNLADQQESFMHKTWILPFRDEIKGL